MNPVRHHLVAILGQSNASGTNTDFDPDGADRRDPRILMFPATGDDAGRLVPAREPMAPLGGHPPGGMGPGGPFASLLLPTLPQGDRVVLVPAAIGGTGFRGHGTYPGVWKAGLRLPGTPNLLDAAIDHVIAALRAAGPRARLAAVLWHQGEADGRRGRREEDYAADLDELIGEFRRRVPTAGHVPFIVGQLAAERLAAYPNHAGVAAALADTPRRVPLTGYAPAPGPGYVHDETTHFSASGQRLLGASYFEAYRRLVDEPAPAHR